MARKNKHPDYARSVVAAYKRCFATEDGKLVLEALIARFRSRPMIGSGRDGVETQMMTFVRIGEENVISQIEALINHTEEEVVSHDD